MKDTIDIVPRRLRRYVGMRPPLDDQHQRAEQMAFTLITECLASAASPFGRMARNALLLCDATHGLIYSGRYGCIDKPYVKGSRPILEDYIASVVRKGMSKRDQVAALSQSIEYCKSRYGEVPHFLYGESDEETLLKGGGHCSCRSRLLTALCQVIGVQARPVLFWIVPDPEDPARLLGGHTVVEAHVDGAWAFLDPMLHIYCPRPNGRLASILDMRENPRLLSDLPARVKKAMRPSPLVLREGLDLFEAFAWRFLQPVVPTCYSRHDVNGPYLGTWNWATPELREQQKHDYKIYRRVLRGLAQRGKLSDRIYAMGVKEFRRAMRIRNARMPIPA